MAYLASVLTDRFVVKFRIINGARIKPVMTLSTGKYDIMCHLVAESEYCKRSKFAANRSNMHFDWWSQNDDQNYTPPPTPIYNALMFQDLGTMGLKFSKVDFLRLTQNFYNSPLG